MATYEDPRILHVGREYIQTDKGPLWYTVVDIDCEIHVEDTVIMSANRHRISIDNTVFASMHGTPAGDLNNVVKLITVGTSVDNNVQVIGSLSNNNEQVDATVRVYGNMAASTGAWSGSYTRQFAWWAALMGFFYRDINGVMFVVQMIRTVGRWNGGGAVNYNHLYYNGPNSYGNYSDNELNSAINITVHQANLTASEPFMNGKKYGDPYDGGGEDDPEGEVDDGPGTWELPTDELADGGTVYSDLTAGLYRAYAMTASQLLAFSNQLWEVNVLRDLRELVEKPAEIALGLFSYPFDVDSESSAVQIGFNWLSHWSPTNVYGYPIDSEIMYLDFGDIVIDRYSGCFYDYQPFSIIQLHLPYIGFVPLKMSECTGRTLHISYCIDVLNGDFTAHVTSSGYEEHYGVQLLGAYQGNIGKPMPLSQQSIFELVKRGAEIGTAALSMAGAVFMGGGAAIAALDTSHRIQEMSSGSGEKEAMKSAQKLLQHQEASLNRNYQTFRRGAHSIVNNIGNLGEGAGAISRSGSVDGSVGRTSPQQCFAVIQYPDQSRPNNQEILGYPSNIPGPLSKVVGYTEVREIRLHAVMATEGEMSEIEEIVRGGIII